MQWFENLKVTPRLLLSFGFLIVFNIAISFFAITRLSAENERVKVLYADDMVGMQQADHIVAHRLSLGREARAAILHIENKETVAKEEQTMLADFLAMHEALDGMEKTFYTPEGKGYIATIGRDCPPMKPLTTRSTS